MLDRVWDSLTEVLAVIIVALGVWLASVYRRISTNQAVIEKIQRDMELRDENRKELMCEVKALRTDVTDVKERMARIEGRLDR